MTVIERLERIYRRIPKLQCQGKCHESCGPIMCSRAEATRMHAISGAPLRVTPELTCGYLTAEKRCSVYAARPLICRVWGAVEAMRCEYGCIPDRWLSDAEVRAMLAEIRSISSEIVGPIGLEAALTRAQKERDEQNTETEDTENNCNGADQSGGIADSKAVRRKTRILRT